MPTNLSDSNERFAEFRGSDCVPKRANEIRLRISLTAAGRREIETLLHAIFSDWVDFIFVPEPRSFAIYADHDEYTTFFAHTRSNLNQVVTTLVDKGFKTVPGYDRRL